MALLHEERLQGVDDILAMIVRKAAVYAEEYSVDLTVSEGLRTKERQQELFEKGKSKTLNSKHLEGKAVDLYIIRDRKIDWQAFDLLYNCMQRAADDTGAVIEWGGNWKMRDCPHFQLNKTPLREPTF